MVTGAASGMGLAFARRFAAEGMNVVLADIEEEALEAQVRQLEQEERTVLGVVVNTMRREALEELRDRTIAEYGNIHILCNNAGVTSREDAGLGAGNGGLAVWEVPDSTWDWVMGVNFWGVLYGLQVFMPHMHGHGEEGHIVNTASVAGLIPGGSAYSVSKHGVLTLTEGLHGQLKLLNSKIGASVLCPGFVNTKIAEAERNRPAEFGEKLTDMSDEQTQAVAAILGSGDGSGGCGGAGFQLDCGGALLHPAARRLGRGGAQPRGAHHRAGNACDGRFRGPGQPPRGGGECVGRDGVWAWGWEAVAGLGCRARRDTRGERGYDGFSRAGMTDFLVRVWRSWGCGCDGVWAWGWEAVAGLGCRAWRDTRGERGYDGFSRAGMTDLEARVWRICGCGCDGAGGVGVTELGAWV